MHGASSGIVKMFVLTAIIQSVLNYNPLSW